MGRILDGINGPKDVKKLTLSQLEQLAGEIRSEMIATVARTGGHIAPNLGVVELTLALHFTFDSPKDKFIWDVGHQCYVHKLLTGRREKFDSLRQYGGISGFPKREESPHDAFNTGHSSTSISAAVGMALAREKRGEKYEVVAIIGDGALTGGMAFEALNHAGHLGIDLIVILNDNEMSIASNVGALSSYLSRLRTDPMYFKGKEEFETLLRKVPHIGPRVVKVAERVKDSLKYLVVPGMLFEELGFTYLGPIDGHNIAAMNSVFKRAKSIRGPVLIHVITKKGKGYRPAEENPDTFHGIGPFDIRTGSPIRKNGPPSYTSVFGNTLVQLAREDERIIGITAAMPNGTGLDIFAKEFPARFYDVGIAEQHAVTLAAGMAVEGFKPVVAIYSTFLQRAYDQILHDVCLQNLPVVFAIDRAGIVGEDGETHQGLFDFSYLRSIPNMTVMAPKDENELRHMLATAITFDGPIALRYPRGSGTGVRLDQEVKPLPVGKAEVLREGQHIVILAIGRPVYDALAAAEELASLGIEAGVINCRFVKPLDEELIKAVARKVKRIVTVEEHVLAGGFGSAVLELLARERINDREVLCLGIPDEFVPQGKADILRAKYGLTAEGIKKAILSRFPVQVSYHKTARGQA
ncbi:1-deoxy-D-xylulose-5-phosphate synthase [Calderihabitans maritimus]|uniref:1-deoxy-D-xylulose-5-phosphate synthase n=1 Tax=Calderihabitans maritimus TaxID=1246530 RepID=A0A1Z5HY24_9FIRM|nr:1-deoxy-D-xylulose-5-phosphate synthase [Calderihabitans maritimus]GAW94190.1 deoxyxylulose-5-phosphate synthase [Calderihabitans maritimus]